MKTKLNVLICLFCSLLILNAAGQKKDPLGASDAELDRLKQLNTTNQVTSLSDTELRRIMVGKWTTGRHEYEYKVDGTWVMLPTDISTTRGRWRIENHQLIQDSGAQTIMEADQDRLVAKNEKGTYPFRYARIKQ
jgi:hypothetical protein